MAPCPAPVMRRPYDETEVVRVLWAEGRASMKYEKVIVSRFGGPEVLQVVEEELRKPSPGEVLVRVSAAGVARADCSRRSSDWSGQVPPFPLGYDFAGRVDSIGAGVTSFKAGQMVAGINENLNSYAEYVYVSPEWMVPIPGHVDPAQAACLGLNYLVAAQCLHRLANVRVGGRILILGASGGVGTALIELARLAGLEVHGTAAPGKIDRIRDLDAVPIDYQGEDLRQRIEDVEFDAVFDTVFDRYFDLAYPRLRADGKYVVIGFAAPPQEHDRLLRMIQAWHAPGDRSELLHYRSLLEPYVEELSPLADLLARGKIAPLIHERVPLREAARAHQLLESGVVTGKVVLTCEDRRANARRT